MKPSSRMLVAFLIAPATAPVLALSAGSIIVGTLPTWQEVVAIGGVVAVVSYLASILLGLPLIWLMPTPNKMLLPTSTIVGIGCGAIITWLIIMPPLWSDQFRNSLIIGGILGGSVAFVFGLISTIRVSQQ